MTAPRCVMCPRPLPPRRRAYCSRSCVQKAIAGKITAALAPEVRALAALPRLCACGAPTVPARGVRGPASVRCETCRLEHRRETKRLSKKLRGLRLEGARSCSAS